MTLLAWGAGVWVVAAGLICYDGGKRGEDWESVVIAIVSWPVLLWASPFIWLYKRGKAKAK